MEIHYVQHEDCPTIVIGQYPLVLSWAMTIHKIQGATLPKAEIDIGVSIFECGQTYVALSRVQSLDGLYLTSFDPSKIRINPTVIAFYDQFPKIDFAEELEQQPTQSKTTEPVDFTAFEHKEESTTRRIRL
jgi:ATP-dependent DNA helicase PIF1